MNHSSITACDSEHTGSNTSLQCTPELLPFDDKNRQKNTPTTSCDRGGGYMGQACLPSRCFNLGGLGFLSPKNTMTLPKIIMIT